MAVRVLLIDDEPQILSSLKRLLKRRGFDVSTAGSAEDALEQLQTVVPDVVISDFKLPGMNGGQLLTAVAKVVPSARRVLLSGYAEVGADLIDASFIRKPWNEVELLSLCALGRLP